MFTFINDLCESHLIPSKTSLEHWKPKKIAELAYLYILGLAILLNDDKAKKWAMDYCKKAAESNDFLHWRADGNDLYVLLHALSADPENDDKKAVTSDVHVNPGMVRTWLRNSDGKTHNLFIRLDAMFHITDGAMKSLRRIITEWDDAEHREQQDVLVKLTQLIHDRAPSNSELLPQLKKLVKMDEAASMGATGAASIATSVSGLGTGFADEEWRSVFPKKKKSVIHR